MSTINQKLGLRPRTRTRKATHAPAIISDATCPTCGGRHVVEHVIRGVARRLCGFCSTSWDAPPPPDRELSAAEATAALDTFLQTRKERG